MSYSGFLKDGSEVYIPDWPIDAALDNLATAGKYLGTDNLLMISEINVPAVIMAIAESENPRKTTSVIKHFVCAARMDGLKITPDNVNSIFEGKLSKLTELFATVVHAQYHDFFVSGLVKEVSPKE